MRRMRARSLPSTADSPSRSSSPSFMNLRIGITFSSWAGSIPRMIGAKRWFWNSTMTGPCTNGGVATIDVPARTDIAAVAQIGRVETQAGDHREHVTVAGVNRDPTAAATFAVTKKIARRQRLLEHAGIVKGERNCAGTIVTVIMKRSVSPAPNIRSIANRVHRPDCMFDAVGRVRRRVSNSIPQHCAISGDYGVRTTYIESRSSRFRIVFVTLDRLNAPSRSRRVIGALDRLRARRLSIERKRLQRHPVGRLRRINCFATAPGLALGLGG